MIHPIGEILKSKLATLTWLERLGGIVVDATKPKIVTGADNVPVVVGNDVYPVACGTTDAACWDSGKYKHFVPDSGVTAVGFFRDGGVTLQTVQENNARVRFAFELQFLCWLNLQRLGLTDCDWTGMAVPHVVSKLWGDHSATGVFSGGEQEQIYQQITVSRVRQLPKSPSLFQPYSFVTAADKRGLFLYPYDYFGLAISGTFDININCLPALVLPGSAIDCLPA